MTLTKEQIKELKRQLSEQIKSLPKDKKLEAQRQIDNMPSEALETMLKQQSQPGKNKSVFRAIVDGEIPSKKVDENKKAIAVVSVRPVSKGHILVIPRKAVADVSNMPKSAFGLAQKIAKKVVSKLDAKSSEIQMSSLFNETVVNVIPVYEKEVDVNSQPYDASENELNEVYKKLKGVKKPRMLRIKKTKPAQEKVVKLKRRIP